MIKNVLFVLIIWILLLGAIEFAAGFVAGDKYPSLDHINPQIEDEMYGYFAPDQNRLLFFPGLDSYRMSTNGLGFRSVGVEITEESIQDKEILLCLGDSHTLSLFVDDKDSYPYQLQQLIKESGSDAVVLNAGVGNATITDYFYYLQKKGIALKPATVIINFSANDIDNLNQPVFKWDEYRRSRQLDVMHHLRNSNTVRAMMRLYMLFKLELKHQKIKDPREKRIMREGSDSLEDIFYVMRQDHYQEVVINPSSENLKPLWNKYFKSLGETIQLLQSQGTRVIFFIKPQILSMFDEQLEINYEDLLKDFLENYGVTFVDVTPRFIDERERYRELFVKPPQDFHLGVLGNMIVAEMLYEVL
jgi:lysophospholipase L1-like esterase